MNNNLTVKIERAISELRRGNSIVVSNSHNGISVLLFAAEFIDEHSINTLSEKSLSIPSVILTANRAKAIGIQTSNQPCSIITNKDWSVSDILSLCTPLYKHDLPLLNGVICESVTSITYSCLLLLRQSRLLPAGLMSIIYNLNLDKVNQWAFQNNFLCVSDDDIKNYEISTSNNLQMSVKANVPIASNENCEIVIFQPKDGGNEHFCLIFGKTRDIFKNPNHNQVPYVRIHSQCITGDILDSLKCDCGEQLKMSVQIMGNANEGVLIYLAQEGRDIGLLNKLRAYNLQDSGMDTVDANEKLGFNDDERLYYPAKEILSQLNIDKIKLLTNNPKKVKQLSNMGIKIQERIPIKIIANKFNKNYLNTKSEKSGHIL